MAEAGEGRESRLAKRTAVLCALVAAALLWFQPAAADAAQGPGRAVVLVSGFDTVTPFTTPDPACSGKEGRAWSPAGGVAATLRANGYAVFTAPVRQGDGTAGIACAPGTAVPPPSTYINSNGDVNANGAALGGLLAFLKTNYGITTVDLVGHSDGGLWSRSAITQQSNYPGVTIDSLTTLGTPHTGSFVADLAEDFSNGTCEEKSDLEQLVCLALRTTVQLVIDDLGERTTEELSSDYLRTWNPEQRIGSCQVTGINGTYFHLPLPSFLLPAYYNPSDGLVGQASAQNQTSKTIDGTPIPAAPIPSFKNGGSFPVVHGTSFAFLTSANLLDTQAVSNAVVAALAAVPAGGPACTTTQPPAVSDGRAAATVPLHQYVAPRGGTLPDPQAHDQVLSHKKVRISCGSKRLGSIPFLGNPKLRVTVPRCERRLRVTGKGRALLIRTQGTAKISVKGKRVRVRAQGLAARSVGLKVEGPSKFIPIPLDAAGRGRLPAGTGPLTLRVNAGPSLTGSATVSR